MVVRKGLCNDNSNGHKWWAFNKDDWDSESGEHRKLLYSRGFAYASTKYL
jgi:hypothetical protein